MKKRIIGCERCKYRNTHACVVLPNCPEAPMIAYISGHLDLTDEEWAEHYFDSLYNAIMLGHDFVVGDAGGTDTMAQMMLAQFTLAAETGKNLVTVYHMLERPRNLIADFATIGGFTNDKERDEAMTLASDYDIAWVRQGREKSGTAKNLERRIQNAKTGH
jgi:hypothetical protein